ncbi:Ribosomal RNA small subunit methyltransferase B [Myxococcaceae bacterium]|jgi:16S rRNA (cytosine967-C5)-methyltransferase|nr:Ribosomal RNA small subunit methyltransferase B [Myxococcaceae bacterium]
MLALRVLSRVEQVRAFADLSLHAALARSQLAAADRALATELVYGTLRWRGRLDFLLSQVSDRTLDELDPLVLSTLRVGAYQLVFSDRIPASAAVDESVRCVQAAGADRASGFVNAVLRRLAAEHVEVALPALGADPIGHLVHVLSLPRWIAERWIERFGATEAAALAEGLNRVPPRTVRANRLRTSRDALVRELRERHPEAAACRFAPDGIVLGRRGDPGLDPAFRDGRMTVQDEASQLVIELLDPQPAERVLDACAAPGAKSTAIAERVGATGIIHALDRHERRLGLLLRDVRRLGLSNVSAETRDASQPLPERLSKPGFDRVLVDAPCSGLGALRRNPDARWRVQPEDVGRLAELQAAILRRAAACSRPGGTLVYSTCTLLVDENEAVVEGFLRERPDFRLVPRAELPATVRPLASERGTLHCLPHRHDSDGFFAARLERLP